MRGAEVGEGDFGSHRSIRFLDPDGSAADDAKRQWPRAHLVQPILNLFSVLGVHRKNIAALNLAKPEVRFLALVHEHTAFLTGQSHFR